MAHLFIAAGIFHPEPGGPATYLHELLPALQARAWDVRVLTYGDPTPDLYPYPVTRVPRRVWPLRRLAYARAARPLLAWADVVYAHTIDLPLIGSSRAPRILKIVGDQAWERCIRRGWIPPDTDIDTFQHTRYNALVRWQQAARARQVRAMRGIIVPAQYLKQMVMGWGVPEARIQVIYNALPPAPALPATRAELRHAWGWGADPIILTAARLTRWKGVDHLITALRQVPEARLMVAGEGDDLPRLRALAADLGARVVFLGRLPREKLYAAMHAADYFALYSGYEGLPHTLLEALRAGTPVIASAKGGNPEVVRSNHNGLLVPYIDHAALVETLRHALQPGVRARLAAHTPDGLERFAFDQMIAQTDAALRAWGVR